MEMYKPNEFAEMLGVSVETLQRWYNNGKLKAFRNPYKNKIEGDRSL